MDPEKGSGLRTIDSTGTQTSSWGGSVLLDHHGIYHMFSAEMTNSVGIKSWRSNSRVVHATADSNSTRPWEFTRQDVAQPVFAHEPTVSRAPDGSWVMFFTTNAGEKPGSQCSLPLTCGTNGTSCLSDPNAQQCPCGRHCAPLSTRMSWAQAPEGPWSAPVLVPSKGGGDTNLACIIRANSSLVCLGRPSLGILRADHWRNVSSYSWHRIEYGQGEDPMIWVGQSSTGKEVLHAVLHGGGWGDPFGHHYFSEDGGWSWRGAGGAKVYENQVEVVGQNPKILSRRERPHVVLDAANEPVALTTGVTEAWPCCTPGGACRNISFPVPDRPACTRFDPFAGRIPDCGVGSNASILWCPVDYCYTLLQALQ